jgi:hypothetical protein
MYEVVRPEIPIRKNVDYAICKSICHFAAALRRSFILAMHRQCAASMTCCCHGASFSKRTSKRCQKSQSAANWSDFNRVYEYILDSRSIQVIDYAGRRSAARDTLLCRRDSSSSAPRVIFVTAVIVERRGFVSLLAGPRHGSPDHGALFCHTNPQSVRRP